MSKRNALHNVAWGAILEALLAVGIAAMAQRGASRLSVAWKTTSQRLSFDLDSGVSVRPGRAAVGSLAGFGVDEVHFFDVSKNQDSELQVAFILHVDRLASDVGFWTRVSKLLRTQPVSLVGFCDGMRCIDRARRGGAPTAFPVVGFGQVQAMNVLQKADESREFLVVDEAGMVVGAPGWSDQADPTATADRIRRLL